MKLIPEKIIEDIRGRPPLQRKEVATRYAGNPVDWRVSFFEGEETVEKETNKPKLRITCFPEEGERGRTIIQTEVDPEEYPQFKVMNEGESFSIKGKVEHVHESFPIIVLKNATIDFHETKDDQQPEKIDKQDAMQAEERDIFNPVVSSEDSSDIAHTSKKVDDSEKDRWYKNRTIQSAIIGAVALLLVAIFL